MTLLGLGLLAFVDAAVWFVAYRAQEPPTQIRVLGANVTVICVNVAFIAVLALIRAVKL